MKSDAYYINMAIAWYFATALALEKKSTLPLITSKVLPIWTHNKAIQKACESYRISKEEKDFLRQFKLPRA